MTKEDTSVAAYCNHAADEEAVQQLQRASSDMRKQSMVGEDCHTKEHVVGHSAGDRMKYWGKRDAFRGGVRGLLLGAAVFAVPGVGPVLVAGPLVAWVVGAPEGTVVVGGLGLIGAGLYSIGIPKDSVPRCEAAVKPAGSIPVFAEMEKMAGAIRRRAFDHFLGRGGIVGSDLDDWFRAERELLWSPGAEMTQIVAAKAGKKGRAVPGTARANAAA